MKNILLVPFFLALLFFDKDIQKAVYPKFSFWMFENDGDIKKEIKNVDAKKRKLIEFGQKLDAVKEKKSGDKTYYQVALPDKTKYWADASFVTEKYITINSTDVLCYTQPSKDYLNGNFKLQPGDFAYFVKEQDGFINVDFISYIPRGKDNKAVWIGNIWLNGGYTDDINTAKEAYWLNMAYSQIYSSKPNIENAKKFLKTAIEVNQSSPTEVAQIAQNVLSELK